MNGYDSLDLGALWHGDGVAMVQALGRPVDLLLSSPPYGIGVREYEDRRPLEEYLEWQRQVLAACIPCVATNGAVIWQVGTWVDHRTGAVFPLDIEFVPMLRELGLTLRARIAWVVGHGLHATRRLSGRYETALWLTKSAARGGYTFDLDPIRVPQRYPGKRHHKGPRRGQLSCNPLGANPSDVWEIPQVKHNHRERTGGHPCQMPLELASRLVLMASRPGDLVCDPFAGTGTTVVAAAKHGRCAAGADLRREYVEIASERLDQLRSGTLPERPWGPPQMPPGWAATD